MGKRKERRGEVVVQLSTTPSVRDDESSEITEVTQVCRGHLNTVSTFVLGLQEELEIIQRERKKRGGETSDVVIQASATLSVRDNKCSKNNGSDQTLKGHDVSRYTLNNYHNELGTGSYLTIRLLNSTIHIPWRRKERRGELIIQLSTTPSVRDDGSSGGIRLNNTIISTFVLGLLNSTIHIPWRRKERGGELIIQLSTTPSVRDDGSSGGIRLNNTIISTFVLGLLNST